MYNIQVFAKGADTMVELKKLPDSELEIMLVVWQSGEMIHTGTILNQLDKIKKHKLQSVQVLLGRLVGKGFLRCEKVGRLNYYTPLVNEESYKEFETNYFVKKLYGNSPVRLMAALAQRTSMSAEDLEKIKKILDGE